MKNYLRLWPQILLVIVISLIAVFIATIGIQTPVEPQTRQRFVIDCQRNFEMVTPCVVFDKETKKEFVIAANANHIVVLDVFIQP